jgi:hypothetical protein
MTTGHIKLGPPDDVRPLLLLSPNNYQATPANPFAARISTSNPYGDLDSYSEWVATDWRAGTGKRDPETGMLFSHLDTRFPNQAILPMGWTYPVVTQNVHTGDAYAASDVTVTVGNKAAVAFTYTGTTTDAGGVWVYLDAADGTIATVQIYSSSGGSPDTVVSTGTATVNKLRPGPIWLYVQTTSYTATNGATYHIAISGTATLTAPAVQGVGHAYTSSWAASTYGFTALLSVVRASSLMALQAALTDQVLLQNGDGITLGTNAVIDHLAVVRGNVYMAYANAIYKLDAPTATSIGTVSARITSMISVGDELWIAYGTGHAVYVSATATLTDNTGTPADLFCLFDGYMWRADGSSLYYTSDGSTWTTVSREVGGWDTQIRGMAGMGRDLYCATDDGLYMVAPGDMVVQVAVWPSRSESNGVTMVNWENSLYIALAEDVVRFDQSGGLQQVGLRTGEELPSDVQGAVTHLRATNYFLLASVAPADTAGGYGSLWAYNGQGWHCIGLAPQGVAGGDVAIDNANSYIWWGQDFGLAARSDYPSSVINPVRDDAPMRFARYGWLEFDRFYGGFVGLEKDMESVYCDTEAMTSARLYVYWQDDESTGWELLGSSAIDDFEARWADYATRPATRWIKLGLLFRTDDEELTPILRAHRLKFHSMITDRWRWQMTLGVHDYPEMLDGEIAEYTAAQQKAHLEACIQSVPPVIFEDVDGTQYEVKVVGAARSLQQFEYLPGGSKLQYVYALTLEQVTADVYDV